MRRRILRFLAAAVLLLAAGYGVHRFADPAAPPAPPKPPPPPEGRPDAVSGFLHPHYDAGGRLAWTVEGDEAFLTESGTVEVRNPRLRWFAPAPAAGRSRVLSVESGLAEVSLSESERAFLREAFARGTKGKARNDGSPSGPATVRFPGPVTCSSDDGLSFRTSDLLCRTVPGRTARETAERFRMETDRETDLLAPGFRAKGLGLTADADSSAFTFRRDATLSLDSRIRVIPEVGAAVPLEGGLEIEAPEGMTATFSTGLLSNGEGEIALEFPGPFACRDFGVRDGVEKTLENVLKGGGGTWVFRAAGKPRPGEPRGKARLELRGIEVRNGFRWINADPRGAVDAMACAEKASIRAEGDVRNWLFEGMPKVWIWDRSRLGLGFWTAAPLELPDRGGTAIELRAEKSITVREERAGPEPVFRVEAAGPVRVRSHAGVALTEPEVFLTQAEKQDEGDLGPAIGRIESEARASEASLTMRGGLGGSGIEEFRAWGDVVLCGFGDRGSPPEILLRAREAAFRVREDGGTRTSVLSLEGFSGFHAPGARFGVFGVPDAEPGAAFDRTALDIEGLPGSSAVVETTATRKGDRWENETLRILVKGGGKVMGGAKSGSGKDPVEDFQAELFEGSELALAFRAEGSGARWDPFKMESTGEGVLAATESKGERVRVSRCKRIVWERVAQEGGEVETITAEGENPAVELRRDLGAARSSADPRAPSGAPETISCTCREKAVLCRTYAGAGPARVWRRTEAILDKDPELRLWGPGRSAEAPEWIGRSSRAVARFEAAPSPGPAGEEALSSVARLEAFGGIELRRFDDRGRVSMQVEGASGFLQPASAPGGWTGEVAGPAKLRFAGMADPARAAGGAPAPGSESRLDALLETPGTVRFEVGSAPDPKDGYRTLHVSAGEPAVLTLLRTGSGTTEEPRARFASKTMEGRFLKKESGEGEAWIVQAGGAECLVWEENGRTDGPEWSFAADRVDSHLLTFPAAEGVAGKTRAELESLKAGGPVRFVNYGEGGTKEARGTGSSLRLETVAPEGGLQGALDGPVEFFFLAEGTFPPLEKGKPAPGGLKTARLESPGPVFFTGIGPSKGATAPLLVRTDREATLFLEAREGEGKPPHSIRIDSEAMSLTAAPPEGGKGPWGLPEVKGKGNTTVKETTEGMTVIATGRDLAYVPAAGEGRFQGDGVKVRIERAGGKK